MEIIKKLKEALGEEALDKGEAKQILEELKLEIENEENEQILHKKQAIDKADREWAQRVVEAQSNIRSKNRRFINAKKQSRINPTRLPHFKKLGKI